MSEVLEIRWHGRGGHGAKTAAFMFREAALETGSLCRRSRSKACPTQVGCVLRQDG